MTIANHAHGFHHRGAEGILESIAARMAKKDNLIWMRMKIIAAIGKLRHSNEKYFTVINLYFYKNHTAPQIAVVIGRDTRTVFRYIDAALTKLDENLQNEGINLLVFNHLKRTHKWVNEIYQGILCGE